MTDSKRKFLKLIGTLCFINLVSFLVYYFCYYVFEGAARAYIFYFYSEIIKVLLPVFSAVSVFVTYARHSVGRCFFRALLTTLPWLIYILPYNAYTYAYGGMLIEDVIFYASLETLFVFALLYLETVILAFIMIAASRIFLKRKKIPFSKSAILSGNDPLDFSTPSVIGVFSGCILFFVYNLVREIIDTVDFIGYAEGIYETTEIIYMVAKYVFILGMLLISHFSAHRLKRNL